MTLPIIERPSPNFNERRIASGPRFLILHYTDMVSGAAALERLCDPEAEVSAHYVIEEHGDIHRLVAEQKRAWHAGVSYWDGEQNINSHSIGIELVNPGHSHGYRKFPAAQMQALIALCREILASHPIPPAHVLGHSDIAPTRKLDPGMLFDWPTMAAAGIGLYPAPDADDYAAAAELAGRDREIRALLTAYGYTPDHTLAEIVATFQLHFYPEVYREAEAVGVADPETLARLSSLLRQKQA